MRAWCIGAIPCGLVGRTLPVIDSLIAATARVHGLTIATRNLRDFSDLGVRLFDPFD